MSCQQEAQSQALDTKVCIKTYCGVHTERGSGISDGTGLGSVFTTDRKEPQIVDFRDGGTLSNGKFSQRTSLSNISG